MALSKTQFYLNSKRKILIKKDLFDSHKDELTIVSRKAELDTAYDLEKAKRQLAIAKIEEEKTTAQSNIQGLRTERDNLEKLVLDLNDGILSLRKEESNLKKYIIKSLKVIDDMLETSSKEVLIDWKLYLAENFSKLEIERATSAFFFRSGIEPPTDDPYEIIERINKKIESEKINQ